MMFPLELQRAMLNSEVFYVPDFYDLGVTIEDAEEDALYARSVDNIKLYDHGFCSRTPYLTNEKVQDFCKIIGDTIKDSRVDAHFYCAYDREFIGFGKHSDETDILYIQCVGETEWEVDSLKYKLKEKDAIFFPAHSVHEVISLTEPRLGCSFGFLVNE